MGFVPHPEIPLGGIRVTDMSILLIAGALWEAVIKMVLIGLKRKPAAVRRREQKLLALQRSVKESRAKGPQAFVETSKLERQQLTEEKALSQLKESREAKVTQWQGVARKLNFASSAVVFVVYYGIPLLEFAGDRVSSPNTVLSEEEAELLATRNLQGFLFPLSYVGIGMRISKWGLPNPKSSIGALIIFWSAQTTVSLLMECVEFLAMV